MSSYIQTLLKVIIFCALLFSIVSLSSAQTSVQKLQEILREQVAFNSDDFSALEKGETIIKFLPTKDKREVSVCGVVRLQNVSEISLDEFQKSLTQRNNKSLIDGGKFSNPPILDDIKSVEFEKNDVEAMKKCEVGKCDLKLSEAMIKRLKTEIDWSTPDNSSPASQLFRQMLFDYLKDYSRRGNAALPQLDSQKKSVRLDEEHQELLNKLLFIKEFAPEFAKYLEDFPRFETSGVENEFYWSKLKFGLKTIVTLTHKATYQRQDNPDKRFLIMTKQIYASRYVDSSLALTFLLSVSASDAYLLFTNVSRSDSLDGLFSELKRNIVEQQAKERATELLQQAKSRMEFGSKNQNESDYQEDEKGVIKQILNQLQNPIVQIFLFIFLVVVTIIIYRKWNSARK